MRPPLESEIQATILEYLEIKGICHYRNNTGAFVRPGTSSFYRFGAVGSPDIVCIINGQYVGIEVKRPGGRLSVAQQQFRDKVVQAGARYLLVFSLDDVIKQL